MLGVSPSHYASRIVNIHQQTPKPKDAHICKVVASAKIHKLSPQPSLSGDFVLISTNGKVVVWIIGVDSWDPLMKGIVT